MWHLVDNNSKEYCAFDEWNDERISNIQDVVIFLNHSKGMSLMLCEDNNSDYYINHGYTSNPMMRESLRIEYNKYSPETGRHITYL